VELQRLVLHSQTVLAVNYTCEVVTWLTGPLGSFEGARGFRDRESQVQVANTVA
jgi:hypothetical protein